MIDTEQACRYLESLDAPGSTFTFQAFDDTGARRLDLAQVIHGRLDAVADRLIVLNKRGAGIFVCVNRTDLKGRRSENVVSLRALFVDIDGGVFQRHTRVPPPTLLVQTARGQHAYWRLRPHDPLSSFTDAQQRLAVAFKGDPVVKDLPRVMRVPGFLHNKGEPCLVTIVSSRDATYSIGEVVGGLPGRSVRHGVQTFVRREQPTDPSAALMQCRRYLAAVPGAVEGAGGDHQTYRAACIAVTDFGLSDSDSLSALADWNAKCSPPWDERDLEAKIRHARRYATGATGSKLRAEHPVPTSASAYERFRSRQRERIAAYLRGAL